MAAPRPAPTAPPTIPNWEIVPASTQDPCAHFPVPKRGGNSDNHTSAGTDGEADQRVPAAMSFASRGDTQNVVPPKDLIARRQTNHYCLVGHALEFGLIRFCIIQHDPDLLARRQLFEVVPATL